MTGPLSDEAPQLPALEIEWTDYVHWENEQVTHHQADQTYWLKTLQGELPVLELSFDRPRPPVQTFNGATEQIVLEDTLIRRLQVLSKQRGHNAVYDDAVGVLRPASPSCLDRQISSLARRSQGEIPNNQRSLLECL
ncbi:condensation domain-containing protein [Bacillus sp. SL00103]